uniref:Uncharacterized protein n=1 Tax=Candidatus Kentrum sp. TUN TaxID=2126343 RepID=A0A451AVM2_9GAMM|nr:MAG: hypothetical protein BECKTUN1418D_GA0071000_10452 [Candidatus Kentron sp. TUN]VFK60644.1 MAG: hypothetical protein BECKTUN1418F_GA0071002_12242 [Candidatus Kentron sp. TUN]VFK69947.1 MAG: hypothetical protein BECKTUN1418E_GA0071001_12224 [Candidatus Kentron sp. TUN]
MGFYWSSPGAGQGYSCDSPYYRAHDVKPGYNFHALANVEVEGRRECAESAEDLEFGRAGPGSDVQTTEL